MKRLIGEQIAETLVERKAHLDAIETIDATCDTEDREPSADELTTITGLSEKIEASNKKLERLREREALIERTFAATPTPKAPEKKGKKDPETKVEANRVEVGGVPEWEDVGFALLAHAQYKGGGELGATVKYCEGKLGNHSLARIIEAMAEHGEDFHDHVIEAADPGVSLTTDPTNVGALIEYRRMANLFIGLWRPKTILGRLSVTRLSFGGAGELVIPRQTAGTVGAWVGEGLGIPVSNIAVDDISLKPKEQGTIVVISQKAISHSNPSALAVIQSDLIEAAARNADLTHLSVAAGTAVTPTGGFNGGLIEAGAVGGDLAAVEADAKALLNHISDNDIPPDGLAWEMHPGMAREISFLRDGNGNRVYPEIDNGVWLGIMVVESTQCVRTELSLIAAGHVMVADDYSPRIDLSGEATLHRDDAPSANLGGATTPVQNMFQTNSVAVRLTQGIDWEKRRDIVSARRTGITW